jgi:hypothetical protein
VSELEILYTDTKTQSIEKSITNFKGDKLKWMQEKRRQRRRDRQRLKNVSKNDMSPHRSL